jgi:hypothetical protein
MDERFPLVILSDAKNLFPRSATDPPSPAPVPVAGWLASD